MSFRPLTALVLIVLLGAGACGKDDPKAKATPEPTASATSTPTASSTPSGTPSATSTQTSPVAGLPSGFPAQSEVPLVSGVVTGEDGGTGSDGRVGWQLELTAVGSQQGCFDRAAAALVDAGFTKRGQMTAGDTKQAQFTTTKWAVIISSRADGQNCQLGYEVGQLTK